MWHGEYFERRVHPSFANAQADPEAAGAALLVRISAGEASPARVKIPLECPFRGSRRACEEVPTGVEPHAHAPARARARAQDTEGV